MSLFLGSVETYDAPICGCKDFRPICRKAVLATHVDHERLYRVTAQLGNFPVSS